ncbi:flavin reductase family protein [Elioraea sp. Yellowstone]|jgi:flavin reductase (DIM6/NTAB) family NADH-FMN oxidoreductase RutF|uniref:flavin reductase family protein n=1 Tax=Elioraea sp. Yellowstone TaxID=2592070 RepID=UPI00115478DD|nr:flavin reductase family protein [Elioraea sp. Yellowstone]TQF80655.1 flavin reductase family protein [Elioraea sp. Yellowstone]
MLFDFAAIGPDNAYKLLVSTVVPRPIAWVTTLDTEGRVNAAPYSFFNAMANDPAVVAIGIGPKRGELKDTGTNIRRTGQFVVNLVSEETAHAMNITAIDVDPGVDELAMAKLTPLASTLVKPPRIAESPVSMECERLAVVEVGNGRAVVLGKVLAMHVRDDCVLDPARCYIDTPRLGLIGRMHGRGWYARTTDRIEIPRITVADWLAGKAAE